MGTKYSGPKKEKLALDVLIALLRASKSLAESVGRETDMEGLSQSQFGVMEALLHLGPLSQRQLTEKILRSSGNLVTVVDNLEKKGLVTRKPVPGDRRKVNVTLTASGTRLIKRVFPSHASAVARAMSVLTAKQQNELKSLCAALGKGQRENQ